MKQLYHVYERSKLANNKVAISCLVQVCEFQYKESRNNEPMGR